MFVIIQCDHSTLGIEQVVGPFKTSEAAYDYMMSDSSCQKDYICIVSVLEAPV